MSGRAAPIEHPRRLLLVGPDGTGKSTVSASLADALAQLGKPVTTGHYRPGLLWKRSPTPTTEPHALPSRPSAASLVKVLAVYGDFVLGYLGPWKTPRRAAQPQQDDKVKSPNRSNNAGADSHADGAGAADSFVILERGWWDHVVDPIRYRLPSPALPVIRLLGRSLPKADVVVILSGDAGAIVARKPELEIDEIQRQLQSWRRVAPMAGRVVVEIDTVTSSVEEVTTQLLTELGVSPSPADIPAVTAASASAEPAKIAAGQDSARRWRQVPGAPARVGLQATAGGNGAAALAIYQPMSKAAKVLNRASLVATKARGGQIATAPVPDLDGLFAAAGHLGIEGFASMTSSTTGRVIVGGARGRELVAVAKVGPHGDEALVNEGEVLRELASTPPRGFVVPTVDFAGDWHGAPAVVATALGRSPTAISLDDALAVAVGLADVGGRFLTHGDFAPWNLRSGNTGLVLLDFEHSVWEQRPLADLAHYLVQTGALLGERPAAETWSLLCEANGLGRRYLAATGIDGDPEVFVGDYIERQLASGRATTEEEQNYLRQLGAQRVRST